MADFKTAFAATMNIEGGYENDKDDSGGETYAGISRNNWPNWAGWSAVDHMKQTPNFPGNLDQSTIIRQLVESFYKTNFWDVLDLDSVTGQPIANELFDLSVNCGVQTAGKFAQRAANALNDDGKKWGDIAVDGVVGLATIRAINTANQSDLLKCIIALQGAAYILICEKNNKQEKFMAGWIRRAFKQLA